MRRFEGLTDSELTTKITRIEQAIEDATVGGGVGKIQGEGRLMEYTRANISGAETLLKELLFERNQRPTLNPNGPCGGAAIGVRFWK